MSKFAMRKTKPTLLIADDHTILLEHAIELLSEHFEIVGAVADGEAALSAATELNPDIVVMDILMPHLDGIRAARGIRRNGISSRIVFITVNEDPDFVQSAFDSGASAYVIKSRLNSDLLFAIDEAMAGRTFTSPMRSKSRMAAV